MHEIVTLQLGQRANYLATHFWNLQESYFTYNDSEETPVDHDVHFRPGVVIYDLKGGFGTLRKYNALYELSEEAVTGLWDGQEVVQKQAPILQSDYQKSLDLGTPAPRLTSETVRYWSDYNRVFYHPRSIVQMNEYELNSQIMPFEDWNTGGELFNDLDKEHDLLDRDVRPFAEECDQLRALQLFSGADDAWGGFAARYIDRLRDEYGKKSIWVWAIEDGTKVQRHQQMKKDINKANYLQVDRRSRWQTTALMCSAVETVTLPSRLRPYHDFESSLAGDDGTHNIYELQTTFNPREHGHKSPTKEDGSPQAEIEFDIDFTYGGESSKSAHIFNQVQVMRGDEPENVTESIEQDLGHVRRLRLFNSEPMLQSYYTPLRLPMLDSFPHGMYPKSKSGSGVSVLAALTASNRTAERIKAIETSTARMLSVDEREAMLNGLGEIRESYETGWSSGSEDDDD
ncbi:uncharacterized protein N7477_002244 [Penicillium maclennaniae]|uniref:uncharacterized protein n=1 Tax=Penicillium maclennaniae TaxID=1343394 RepID=UPI0025406A59|nr:uncharacterized protein N7477_002244 [Penicillium maclennaniae]KAJ5676611.1 hypothetical protein N7477_002244 [Penicillium maclennaniae]